MLGFGEDQQNWYICRSIGVSFLLLLLFLVHPQGLTCFLYRGPISPGGSYSFSSHGKRGAVAVLDDGGVQETVVRSTAFQEYIYNHHQSWHAFAKKKGHSVEVEEIVLVSGFVKTSSWAVATYAGQESSHDFSLSVGANGVASASADFSSEEKTNVKVLKRSGPGPSKGSAKAKGKASSKEKNQCLFVQYYKCLPKGFGLKKIRGPNNLTDKDAGEVVPNSCFCAPFIGISKWMKRTFGGCCCRTNMAEEEEEEEEKEEEDTQERVSTPL